jgi:hypothetical protein
MASPSHEHDAQVEHPYYLPDPAFDTTRGLVIEWAWGVESNARILSEFLSLRDDIGALYAGRCMVQYARACGAGLRLLKEHGGEQKPGGILP